MCHLHHPLLFKYPPKSIDILIDQWLQGVHEVEFRWFTRPEMSEPGSELTPLCGVVNDNCPEEIRPNTEEVKGTDYRQYEFNWNVI